MLGPPTPTDFLPDVPTGYKIAYYPERLQPYTIWHEGKVVRFEGVEMAARKYVEKESARESGAGAQSFVRSRDLPSDGDVDLFMRQFLQPPPMAVERRPRAPRNTPSISYWSPPQPSDRASVIE